MSNHIKLVHRDNPYKCQKCTKKFNSKYDLNYHEKLDHLGLSDDEISKFAPFG